MDYMKFDSETLDKIEDRYIKGLLGEVEVAAAVLEQMRKILDGAGRIVPDCRPGSTVEYEVDEDDELEAEIERLRLVK